MLASTATPSLPFTGHVELVSLDPANHPVPGCLRFPKEVPSGCYTKPGAAGLIERLDTGTYRLDNAYCTNVYYTTFSDLFRFLSGPTPMVCGHRDSRLCCHVYTMANNSWSTTPHNWKVWGRQDAAVSSHPSLGLIFTGGSKANANVVTSTLDGKHIRNE